MFWLIRAVAFVSPSRPRQTVHSWSAGSRACASRVPLTLRSPAVMFCSAPAAASVVCRLSSQRWSRRLYRPTIWGLHSHSWPLGSLETSAKVSASAVRGSWAGGCRGSAGPSWPLHPRAPACAHLSKPPTLRREAAHHLAGWRPGRVPAAPALEPLQGRRRHLVVQAVGEVPQHAHGVLHALRRAGSGQDGRTSWPPGARASAHLVLALAHIQGVVDVGDQGVHQPVALAHLLASGLGGRAEVPVDRGRSETCTETRGRAHAGRAGAQGLRSLVTTLRAASWAPPPGTSRS